MSELEELEKRIRKLSPQELAKFRAWFAEFDHALWDRQIESDDCGAAAAYLLSEEAANVSGTTLYVDAGYHAMGM